MSMKSITEDIRVCIMESEVEQAIKKLKNVLSLANSELVNDLILLSAQFKKLKSDIRKGIIDYSQQNISHNKIIDGLLSLVHEIEEEPEILKEYTGVDEKLNKASEERNLVLPMAVKDALYERLALIKEKNIQFKALWIDDNPMANVYETKILEQIHVQVEQATSSRQAYELVKNNSFDFLLSDIGREKKSREGIEFQKKLIEEGIDIPLIFYIARHDRSKGVPPYAFGIADLPNELLHIVADILQRKG